MTEEAKEGTGEETFRRATRLLRSTLQRIQMFTMLKGTISLIFKPRLGFALLPIFLGSNSEHSTENKLLHINIARRLQVVKISLLLRGRSARIGSSGGLG